MMNMSSDSAKRLGEALAALQAGRIDAAKDLARQLFDAAPRDPAVHQLQATIALRRQRFEDAARWARSCLALRPGHPPALVLAGRAAKALGEPAQALDLFRRAAQGVPAKAEAAFLVCVMLLEQADPEANTKLSDLLQRFPAESEGWHEIGVALRNAGQFEGALAAFTRATAAASVPRYHIERAMALRALGRISEAIEALRTARTLAPEATEISLQLALCLHRLGDDDAARLELEQLVAIDAGNGQAWFALGLVLQDMHEVAPAIAAYRKAIELRPAFPEAYVNLGICLQQTRDLDAAKGAYGAAVQLRADTFGRIAQALPSAPKGELWLDPERLRHALSRSREG
jgi:tetratricopeptide (TPR) repeat protein